MHLIGDTVLCVGEANADLVMYTGGGHSGKQAADIADQRFAHS